MVQAHPISDKLISWYKRNKRDLPWRDTKNPYNIWLSEIILQQTQVIQGTNYYLKFIKQYPLVSDLANAPEDEVMRLWQGLGYYSRARNLHAAAKDILVKHKGKFPNTYEDIKALKGIGDYTAAAIASFAFDLPYAVVDGNVYRVLSRLFNIHTPINSSAGKKEFQLLADELLNKKQPLLHNSAMMEFGALYCKTQNPKCSECVLQAHCLSFASKTTSNLPVRTKSLKIKSRYFHYFIFNYRNEVYINKRTDKDIWQNLYEFYLIETENPTSEKVMLKNKLLLNLSKSFQVKKITTLKKHILSHQHIYATFYELEINSLLKLPALIKIKRKNLQDYGFPQLINKYLEKA
jgi:A/G-specific adenine glycosylase